VCGTHGLRRRKDSGKLRSLENRFGYLSDVGRKRDLDEDSVLIVKAFSTYGEKPAERTLLIVADGMGGHSKGELASSLGTSIVTEACFPKLIDKDPKIDYEATLSDSMKQANQKILNYSIEHPECEGMGTTMTAAIVDEKQASFAHVGDTRAYIINAGKITQLTKDHSYVQELVDKGEITPEEARIHPKKNVIRMVGVRVGTTGSWCQNGETLRSSNHGRKNY
jgi:protein phosphatase